MKDQRRLLLASSSNLAGTNYLDHCEAQIRELFAGVQEIVFVPYALKDLDGYTAHARARFERLGIGTVSPHESSDPKQTVATAKGMFIGGGNTFRLVKSLQDLGLVEPIRERVAAGMPYMGTSAGSNVACPTLKTTNDMPIVQPDSFAALNLVPFQINAHYLDPDPNSKHMGETRETRLREFHEENATAVVGLREGALLWVTGRTMKLVGAPGGMLFRQGQGPSPLADQQDLSDLL